MNNHFQHITTSSKPSKDVDLRKLITPCVSAEDNEFLLKVPDATEIRNTIAQMPSWKTPGPDGFQIGLYKHNWEIVFAVHDFFKSQRLDPNLNLTYQTLIP